MKAARYCVILGLAALLAGCSGGEVAPAPAPEPGRVIPAPLPMPTPTPESLPPAEFAIGGELTQGGWLRGVLPAGTVEAKLDGKPLPFAADGAFFAAFDRDAGTAAMLWVRRTDGSVHERTLAISPRAWNIERVNVARRSGGATAAYMKIREPELAQIAAARAIDSGSEGWRQNFIWPVKGRISGRFGSQRIYKGGEAGSYHSGIDITSGVSGTPFAAPADGVVILATETPFSLEGYLLMIDHGNGLNSAFLHCSKIDVKLGDRVTQGQQIGRIGASGRATGPHLHWSLKWFDARLDPLLFTGPMN